MSFLLLRRGGAVFISHFAVRPAVSVVIPSWAVVSAILVVPPIPRVSLVPRVSRVSVSVVSVSLVSPWFPPVILSVVHVSLVLLHWWSVAISSLRLRPVVTVLSVSHFSWVSGVSGVYSVIAGSVVLSEVPGFSLVPPLAVVHPRGLVSVPGWFAVVLAAAHGRSAVHPVIKRRPAVEVAVVVPLALQAVVAPCDFDLQLVAFELKLSICLGALCRTLDVFVLDECLSFGFLAVMLQYYLHFIYLSKFIEHFLEFFFFNVFFFG